jgi:type II secretory pathway pseudopilin PulG
LIELLVVVFIVSMLIAIMLPSLRSARDSARACQCLSQMAALGKFTAIYADASRDLMPRSQHSAYSAHAAPWGYAFYEYISGAAYTAVDAGWEKVFNREYRCPMDPRRTRWSYGYNVYFELTAGETGARTWRRYSGVPRASQTVLFAELGNQSSGDHAMAHFWTQFDSPPEIDAQRHRPATGVVFVDGHAQTQQFDTIFDAALKRDCFNPHTAR